MTIEELKALDKSVSPAPWFCDYNGEPRIYSESSKGTIAEFYGEFRMGDIRTNPREDAELVTALRNLAPEILALVEAATEDDEKRFKGSVFVSPTIKAVRAFNAKLAEL